MMLPFLCYGIVSRCWQLDVARGNLCRDIHPVVSDEQIRKLDVDVVHLVFPSWRVDVAKSVLIDGKTLHLETRRHLRFFLILLSPFFMDPVCAGEKRVERGKKKSTSWWIYNEVTLITSRP